MLSISISETSLLWCFAASAKVRALFVQRDLVDHSGEAIGLLRSIIASVKAVSEASQQVWSQLSLDVQVHALLKMGYFAYTHPNFELKRGIRRVPLESIVVLLPYLCGFYTLNPLGPERGYIRAR